MPQPFDFAKGYVLTDEDVKVLRPLIEKHQRDRGNELLFRYGYEEPYWLDEGPPSQRSGTYIALVPVGGIAALTNPAGTGDDNIAGMAVCSIYQIAIDVTGTIATVVDTGLMERIYNLSLAPITSRYVIVHLDRFGRWVAGRTDEVIPASGTSEITNIFNSYSSLETWKKTNIDNTLADDYGLTVCYGPFDLTTFSNDAAVGAKAWEDASDAASANDVYASNYDLNQDEMITNYLKALQIAGGYAPAVGFVPKVVHVTIERRNTGDQTVKDNAVKLVVGGTVQADNQAAAIAWPATDAVMTYRFPTTATRAQTLAADFGVVLAVQYTGSSDPFNATNIVNDSAPSPDWITYWVGSVAWAGSASSASAGNADPSGVNGVALNGSDGFDGFVKLLRAGGSWNPSTQGAFANIGGSFDTFYANATTAGEVIGIHVILVQASTAYTAQITTLTTTDNTTRPHSFTLEASDFTKQSGAGPATPDFTATGGTINIGLATSKSGGTSSAWTVYFDNVIFNINQAAGTVTGGEAAVDHIQIRICGTT